MAVKPLYNESDVLAKIAEGDQRAFTILFYQYERFVYSFARRITASDDEAGEVVQDIFLKLWISRETLVGIDHFPAYLNRLVRNHSLNVVRRQLLKNKSAAALAGRFDEADAGTLQELDLRESRQILEEALSLLSPQQRMVYRLCHEQGLKYEEAAAQMQLSPQTINAYMSDALKKIREHFRRHAMFYPLLIVCLFDR
jgi:RNA polymerase sigma-70 factor (ECF subfamily)